MNDTSIHALFGAPHGPADEETGLPTIEVTPELAEALKAAGWVRDPALIEGEYVEGDWALNVGFGYSIEPSGHHRSVIVHRGPHCEAPAFAINVTGTDPLPPAVVLAAALALIVEDEPDLDPDFDAQVHPMPPPAGGWPAFAERFLGGSSAIDDPLPEGDLFPPVDMVED